MGRVFAFDPYAPTIYVCKRLALPDDQCQKQIKVESTDDDEMLLVFRKDRKVVHSEMHLRWHSDFTPECDEPFTSATAVFSVFVKDQGVPLGDWLMLQPKSGTFKAKCDFL